MHMRPSSSVPDKIDTILAALKECSLSRDIDRGKAVHSQAKAWKLSSNRYVTSGLINMYSRCGSMYEAQRVFDSSQPQTDVVSWTCLIRGYLRNGESEHALGLFESMDYTPTSHTYVAALAACASLGAKQPNGTWLQKGRNIHRSAATDLCCDIFVESALVDMYGKCGSMVDARNVFDNMPRRDVVVWTSLMKGYVENGEGYNALEVYKRMILDESIQPDATSYVVALKACVDMATQGVERSDYWLETGRTIYGQAVSSRRCNMFVESVMVELYSKCHCMNEARTLFDKMKQKDTVTWTGLLQGYVENGESRTALQLYGTIDVRPDARAHVVALTSCANLAAGEPGVNHSWLLVKAKEIHSRAVLQKECNLYVENAVLDVLVKCRSMQDARSVFDGMSCRDAISWTTLLQGYVDNGESEVAVRLFDSMDESEPLDAGIYVAAVTACAQLGLRRNSDVSEKRHWLEKGMATHSQALAKHCYDVFLLSSLVDMYSKFGRMVEAQRVFNGIPEINTVSWNSLVRGYVDNGECRRALELICCMDCLGVERDSATYIAALIACGSFMAADLGRSFHTDLKSDGFEKDTLVATCLLDFYGKCGDMESAEVMFDRIVYKSVVVWNSLMSGYGLQGNFQRVFELLEEMQKHGLCPDEISFVCVLSVCSHAGLTDKGKEMFELMQTRYGVSATIEHYACLVDLLGRANYLDDALQIIRTMPFEADSVIWCALLAACRKWNDAEMAKMAYTRLLKLNINYMFAC